MCPGGGGGGGGMVTSKIEPCIIGAFSLVLILNALSISLSRRSGSRKTGHIMISYLVVICSLRKGHFVFKLIV